MTCFDNSYSGKCVKGYINLQIIFTDKPLNMEGGSDMNVEFILVLIAPGHQILLWVVGSFYQSTSNGYICSE